MVDPILLALTTLEEAASEPTRNKKEETGPTSHTNNSAAVRPNNRDVLFGLGKRFHNQPGNHKMLQYINQYKRQHNKSPRHQKRLIVEEIIGVLTSAGGQIFAAVQQRHEHDLVDGGSQKGRL